MIICDNMSKLKNTYKERAQINTNPMGKINLQPKTDPISTKKYKVTIIQLKSVLEKAWCRKTCYPPSQEMWTPETPCSGQCAVTSLVVQEILGGEIKYCKHLHHYWNIFPDGKELDFTRAQFPRNVKPCSDAIVLREYILTGGSMTIDSARTRERYKLLKQRVEKFLADKL